jgi:internalin A
MGADIIFDNDPWPADTTTIHGRQTRRVLPGQRRPSKYKETKHTDLTPLAQLPQLEDLDLAGKKLFSLKPIAEVVSLKWLRLEDCTEVNFRFALEKLHPDELVEWDQLLEGGMELGAILERLRPRSNWASQCISDLSPLATLTRLEGLWARETQVTDLSPLAGLRALQELYLDDTPVSDLSPLSELPQLTELHLRNTAVRVLHGLEGSCLRYLALGGSHVASLTPLNRAAALEELYLEHTNVVDLSALATISNLTHLNLRHTKVADVSALAEHLNLQELDLSNTDVCEIEALGELSDLRHLSLEGSTVFDVSPLHGMTDLESLYIRNTPLSESQVGELRDALPDAAMFSDYDDDTADEHGVPLSLCFDSEREESVSSGYLFPHWRP